MHVDRPLVLHIHWAWESLVVMSNDLMSEPINLNLMALFFFSSLYDSPALLCVPYFIHVNNNYSYQVTRIDSS